MCLAHGLRVSVPKPQPMPYTIHEFRTKGYACSAPTELLAEAACLRLYRQTQRHHYWTKWPIT